MRFLPLPIAGSFRIELEKSEDERGFFARSFCADEFKAQGLITEFPQQSVSFNEKRGTLRGLHYQAAPYAETKTVRCLSGEIFDVMVDLRRESPSFGRWHAEVINAAGRSTLYIPAGCAHGFQTLVDAAEILYSISPSYRPEAARGLAFDDPHLAIAWPVANPILSAADRNRPAFASVEMFV